MSKIWKSLSHHADVYAVFMLVTGAVSRSTSSPILSCNYENTFRFARSSSAESPGDNRSKRETHTQSQGPPFLAQAARPQTWGGSHDRRGVSSYDLSSGAVLNSGLPAGRTRKLAAPRLWADSPCRPLDFPPSKQFTVDEPLRLRPISSGIFISCNLAVFFTAACTIHAKTQVL